MTLPPARPPRHPLERPTADEREAEARAEGLRQGKLIAVELPGKHRRPYLTYGLIAVNVLLFLLRFVDASAALSLFQAGMIDAYAILRQGELWRLFTGMFLHGSEAHIVMNMLSLYYVGSNVEALFGWRRYALVYFLGGLAGSLLHIFFDAASPAVGASGAIFALVAAEIFYLRQNRHLYGRSIREQYRTLVVVAGMNLLAGLVASGVSFWGHAGGFLGGLALALAISPLYIVPRGVEPGTKVIIARDVNPLSGRRRAVLLYSGGLVVVLLLARLLVNPQPFQLVP
ncbi:MAG: rhomboid family intramembrane serine protease [Anaerolineae bacterium]|jgi:rhomboid protease GluP|nr:rhomboid family intramembrane serine protease [Anaerolineae bacterium]